MKKTKISVYYLGIFLLFLITGCSGERNSGIDQTEGEDTAAQFEEKGESINEEPIPESIKKDIEKKKENRERIIEEEKKKSSFKDYTNKEIQEFLRTQLQNYNNSCDSIIYNEVFRLMQSDMRMKEFRYEEDEFTESFAVHLFALRDSCNQ